MKGHYKLLNNTVLKQWEIIWERPFLPVRVKQDHCGTFWTLRTEQKGHKMSCLSIVLQISTRSHRVYKWKKGWAVSHYSERLIEHVYHQFLHLDSFALSFNISLHALLLDSDDDPGVYANVTSSPTKDGMYRDESFLTTLVGCTLSCRNVKDNPAVSPNRRGRLRELWIPGSKSGGARRWWVP